MQQLNHSSLKFGMAPGTPVYVGRREPQQTVVTVYDRETGASKTVKDITELKTIFDSPERQCWVNVCGLKQVDFIDAICQFFSIHPLVIEDVLNTQQRPKLDAFDDYLYLVLKARSDDDGALKYNRFNQLSLIVKQGVVLSFQEAPNAAFDSVAKHLQLMQERTKQMQIDYLVYLLVDSVVDSYFDLLEKNGAEIESLEASMSKRKDVALSKKFYQLKNETIQLRKVVSPLRDTVAALMHDDSGLISLEVKVYIRDLYDHCMRVLETIDMHREMLTSILELQLALLNNRMNESMRLLAVFATIFIPLTFIASLYGMNFKNMPVLNWAYGFWVTMGVMVMIAVILLIYFRRKRWI